MHRQYGNTQLGRQSHRVRELMDSFPLALALELCEELLASTATWSVAWEQLWGGGVPRAVGLWPQLCARQPAVWRLLLPSGKDETKSLWVNLPYMFSAVVY